MSLHPLWPILSPSWKSDLHQSYFKDGFCTSSCSITWELVRYAISQAPHVIPTESESAFLNKIPKVICRHIKVWEALSTSTISTFTPYIPFSIHCILTFATEITFEDANDNLQITTALEILKSLSFQTSLQYLPSLMSPPWNLFLEILQWLTLQDFKKLFSLPLWPLLSLLCSSFKHCYPLQVSFGPFFFIYLYSPVSSYCFIHSLVSSYCFIYYLYSDHSKIRV